MVSFRLGPGAVGSVKVIIEPVWKGETDGSVLEDCMVAEVLLIFLEEEVMSISKVKSQLRPFLNSLYGVDLQKSPAAAN